MNNVAKDSSTQEAVDQVMTFYQVNYKGCQWRECSKHLLKLFEGHPNQSSIQFKVQGKIKRYLNRGEPQPSKKRGRKLKPKPTIGSTQIPDYYLKRVSEMTAPQRTIWAAIRNQLNLIGPVSFQEARTQLLNNLKLENSELNFYKLVIINHLKGLKHHNKEAAAKKPKTLQSDSENTSQSSDGDDGDDDDEGSKQSSLLHKRSFAQSSNHQQPKSSGQYIGEEEEEEFDPYVKIKDISDKRFRSSIMYEMARTDRMARQNAYLLNELLHTKPSPKLREDHRQLVDDHNELKSKYQQLEEAKRSADAQVQKLTNEKETVLQRLFDASHEVKQTIDLKDKEISDLKRKVRSLQTIATDEKRRCGELVGEITQMFPILFYRLRAEASVTDSLLLPWHPRVRGNAQYAQTDFDRKYFGDPVGLAKMIIKYIYVLIVVAKKTHFVDPVGSIPQAYEDLLLVLRYIYTVREAMINNNCKILEMIRAPQESFVRPLDIHTSILNTVNYEFGEVVAHDQYMKLSKLTMAITSYCRVLDIGASLSDPLPYGRVVFYEQLPEFTEYNPSTFVHPLYKPEDVDYTQYMVDFKLTHAYTSERCTICQHDLEGPYREYLGDLVYDIKCGHLFHPDCIAKWQFKEGCCPVCRKAIVPAVEELPPVNDVVQEETKNNEEEKRNDQGNDINFGGVQVNEIRPTGIRFQGTRGHVGRGVIATYPDGWEVAIGHAQNGAGYQGSSRRILTVDEVLAQLPSFSNESFYGRNGLMHRSRLQQQFLLRDTQGAISVVNRNTNHLPFLVRRVEDRGYAVRESGRIDTTQQRNDFSSRNHRSGRGAHNQ